MKTMKLNIISAVIALMAGVVLSVHAANVEVEASPMTGTNLENASYSVSSDGYISIIFSDAGMFPGYNAGTVVASGSSANSFTGDYSAAGVAKLGFRIRSEFTTILTPSASLVMQSSDGRLWRNPNVEISNEGGKWIANNINFDLASGWTRDGGGDLAAMWAEDIKKVASLGIRVIQNGVKAQTVSVDTFILLDNNGKVVGTSGLLPSRIFDYFKSEYNISSMNEITDEMKNADSDQDGMSDWNELLAGTEPKDKNSVFAAKIVNFEDDGITIEWPCAADGVYRVMKANASLSNFSVVTGDIVPDNTDISNGKMKYKDEFETGTGPYFYKVMLVTESE